MGMNSKNLCFGISRLVIVKPVLYSNGLRLSLRSVFHSNRSFTFMSSSLHLRFAHQDCHAGNSSDGCGQESRWLIESCINLSVSCRIKVVRGPWRILSAGPLRRGRATFATSTGAGDTVGAKKTNKVGVKDGMRLQF